MAQRESLRTLGLPKAAVAPRRSAQTADPAISLVQQDMEAAVGAVNNGTPWKNGRILSLSFTGAGDQSVPHGLEGPPAGFVIVDKDTAASIYRLAIPTSNQTSKTHVHIFATAACNVTVWVWR